jgi:cyanophycin synthetase
VAAWGKVPGLSTTDGLKVGAESIGSGDYSGPEGARRILRDPRVEIAILETARGGIQRRGLVVPRVDVAAITNVAEDHLGEFGVHGLDDIADVKMVVARAVRSGGTLVINADDPRLVARARGLAAHVVGFTVSEAERLIRVNEIPVTFGGAAKHNVANAMTAALLAKALGIPDETIAAGLASFRGLPEENPGRLNLIELGGVRLLIDYAHNPHGMDALVAVAASLPAARRLLLIGQAGDRDDDALRALARSGWALRPDAIVIKEMADYLRGRALGEIPAILEAEFLRLGARREQIQHAPSEVLGVQAALDWSREGDLLVLPTHSNRRDVLALIERLARAGWRTGAPTA